MQYNFYHKDTSNWSSLRSTYAEEPARQQPRYPFPQLHFNDMVNGGMHTLQAIRQLQSHEIRLSASAVDVLARLHPVPTGELTTHTRQQQSDRGTKQADSISQLMQTEETEEEVKARWNRANPSARDFDFDKAFDRDFHKTFVNWPIERKAQTNTKAPSKVKTAMPTPSVADDGRRYPQRSGRRLTDKGTAHTAQVTARITKPKTTQRPKSAPIKKQVAAKKKKQTMKDETQQTEKIVMRVKLGKLRDEQESEVEIDENQESDVEQAGEAEGGGEKLKLRFDFSKFRKRERDAAHEHAKKGRKDSFH